MKNFLLGERTDPQAAYLNLPSVNADTSQLVVGAGVLRAPLKKVEFAKQKGSNKGLPCYPLHRSSGPFKGVPRSPLLRLAAQPLHTSPKAGDFAGFPKVRMESVRGRRIYERLFPFIMAHLEVNDLRLAVERATLELPPRDHLLMDHPTAQLLHRASQDVLVHLGTTHRFLFHVLLGHLGLRKTDAHACSKPNHE